jgi:hypothetical protein
MGLRKEEQPQELPLKNTISFLTYPIWKETPRRNGISQLHSEFPLRKKGTSSKCFFLHTIGLFACKTE